MTLDRLTAPGDVAFDSRHNCDRCGDHVPTLIRLCAYCATPPRTEIPKENVMTEQPDPRFPGVPPEQIGDTLLLPDYCVEVAELLAATENHTDPTVRAIRKIVTQAAVALKAAHQTSGSAASHRVLPAPVSTSTAEPENRFEPFTKPKRKSSAAVLLMAEHGIEASDIRTWATATGIPVAGRGGLPLDLVQQYLAEAPRVA